MKHYDRKLKKWVEEEKPMTSLKRPETCKGKKPHEWVLMIPFRDSRHNAFHKDDIEKYYEIEEKRRLADEFFDEELKKIGIGRSFHYHYPLRRFYVCSRCLKEKYE
jgi:hypothetical protein